MEAQPTKLCLSCNANKPFSSFRSQKDKHLGLKGSCRDCENEKARERRKDPVLKVKAIESTRNARYKRLYGITIDQFDTMWSEQGGECLICGLPLERGTGHTVDHNHSTGKARAILCRKCNTGLGMFRDSPSLLLAAHAYLSERGCYGVTP